MHTMYNAATLPSSSLTLAPCAKLQTLYVCCCLSQQLEIPSAAKPLDAGPWLHNLITSISSAGLMGVVIDLDVRHIVDTDVSGLVNVSRFFWNQQRYTELDEFLADPSRFKALKAVAIRLLCGHRTPLHVGDSWRMSVSERFMSMFPKLYSRGMLLYVAFSWLSYGG